MAEKDGGGVRYLYEQYSTPLSTSASSAGTGPVPIVSLGTKPQNNGGLTSCSGAAASAAASQPMMMTISGVGGGGCGGVGGPQSMVASVATTQLLATSLNNVLDPGCMMLKSHSQVQGSSKVGLMDGGGGGGGGGGGVGLTQVGVSTLGGGGGLVSVAGGQMVTTAVTMSSVGGGGGGSGSGGGHHQQHHQRRRGCCTACLSPAAASFWIGLLTNLGICALLLAYTLLGSFIFLAIEGDPAAGLLSHHQQQQQPPLASTNRQSSSSSAATITTSTTSTTVAATVAATNSGSVGSGRLDNMSLTSAPFLDATAARQRTVESIWDITVSLNILYRENWTRLAALEIARFQDQLIERITSEMTAHLEGGSVAGAGGNSPQMGAVRLLHRPDGSVVLPGAQYADNGVDWTFARAFLYSLTVLTTIGHGNIAPRTTLGRIVTMVYAVLGIPLTLVYLSSTGGVLARVARGVFSRALCCCLCSNCGYCCYDEKRMAEKERRMRKKREHAELRAQQLALQEPYYVRAGSLHNNLHSPTDEKQRAVAAAAGGAPASASAANGAAAAGTAAAQSALNICDLADSLSVTESHTSMHGLSILAPILLCFSIMLVYIVLGAIALWQLEQWPLLDGVYFCFMSLSTIGFGDLVPGMRRESATTTWFCSAYILSGMALTAMCFNVLHEELAHRVKRVVDVKSRLVAHNGGANGAGGGGCHGNGSGVGLGGVDDPSDYLGS